VFLMLSARHNAMLFVLLSGVVFFGWAEIFSLFPATFTDRFGGMHAVANESFLYLAQGIGAALGGPTSAALHGARKSWVPLVVAIITMDALSALPDAGRTEADAAAIRDASLRLTRTVRWSGQPSRRLSHGEPVSMGPDQQSRDKRNRR